VDTQGRAMTHCPFFFRADDGKVYCRIHTAKPKVCIGFTPWNEGIRDYALNCPACRNSAPWCKSFFFLKVQCPYIPFGFDSAGIAGRKLIVKKIKITGWYVQLLPAENH
jgi:hypothetical protein